MWIPLESYVCLEECKKCPYVRHNIDNTNVSVKSYCGIAADILLGRIDADIVSELNDIPSWCPIENGETR